jgi:hypothetical protein
MKIKNQWIVFNLNQDQLLVETENGKYYLYTYHNGFQEISIKDADKFIEKY